MKIVIAGKSSYMGAVKSILEYEGFEVFSADTPKEAKAFADGYPVVLVGDSFIPGLLIDDGLAQRTVAGIGPRDPVVFILDRGSEAPAFLWSLVFKRAAEIAAYKRQVYVLARSVRSELPDREQLFCDARAHGVTFVKYEDITVENDNELSIIRIEDNIGSFEIRTPLSVECTYKEDRSILEYARALRLHIYDGGLISADRWFLSPGRTSRRGVYYIDSGLAMSMPIEKIVRSIADEVRLLRESADNPSAAVDPKKCAFCYTCYRLCPHGALYPETTTASMSVLRDNCSGCGICVTACPANAIELSSVSGQTQFDREAGTVAFCCENSAAIAAGSEFDEELVRVIPIPCGGSISGTQIASALREYSRVIVAVCHEGACRHFDGSKLARRNSERLKDELASVGIDPGRVVFVQMSHAMPGVLAGMQETERKKSL
jgi:coenzyme F420-reducing hydrogenase delta subunit/Pyruvate/2-oxoacid:ferredoxin oxidoreductase delta subunit